MEKMIQFLIQFIGDNSTQIWTIISVVIGGFVTYFSTSAVERRNNKYKAQKENLEQVLLPYCTCLEQTHKKINQIYEYSTTPFSNVSFEKWINNMQKPLEYLTASKRVYLSKTMRRKLQYYETLSSNFATALEQECTDCIIKYKSYVSSRLENFPNLPKPISISFSIDNETRTKIKIAIINKSDLSLINNFTSIDFVRNDDPENYQSTSISLNKEDRDTWEAVSFGYINISDINNPEAQLSCNLLDYINENITDEKEELRKLIDETQSSNLLSKMTDLLDDMKKELIKTIDKITV